MKHVQLANALANREDEFSQLLSRLVSDEHADAQTLVSRSGLSGDEHAALDSLREDAHSSFRQEMAEITTRLRARLAGGDPLYTLAIIHASNVIRGWGTYYEPTHTGSEGKVELVAGLLLTQERPATELPISDAEMQAVHDDLDGLIQLTLLRNLSAPSSGDPTVSELRFTSAMNWMTIRGTSYAHHGTDLAATLFQPFAEWSLTRYGFTVDDVLQLGETVQRLVTERLNRLVDEARGQATRVVKQRGRGPSAANIDPATLGSRVAIGIFQAGIRDAMSFTSDDLIAAGLPPDRANAALAELSLSVGSLSPKDYGGLFDKSPLIQHPFVEHDGRFLLAIPGMVLRDTVELLEERFMSVNPSFSKARAESLDRLAVNYLTALLPGSKGFTNLRYGAAELDGLVISERTAFVIEGKGSALSVQAQRGDLVRLARDLGRAVEEAWVQGARAREYLLGDDEAIFRDAHGVEVLRVPPGTINEIFIVNPTLHQLAGHASQLPRLQGLGLFPAGEFPWSVFINDLRVISETADNAAVFLHYLEWRARLPLGDRVTAMDELDLWGSYLLCERFPALAGDGHHIVGNSSTDFDAYYAGVVGDGPKQPKPCKFLREPITAFVNRMARERPPGWRDAAGACLDLSLPELAFVIGEARPTWKRANETQASDVTDCGRVRLIGLPRGHDLATAVSEMAELEDDTTFHIYVRGSKAKRGEVVWAQRVKPVTFALSDFESGTFAASSPAKH